MSGKKIKGNRGQPTIQSCQLDYRFLSLTLLLSNIAEPRPLRDNSNEFMNEYMHLAVLSNWDFVYVMLCIFTNITLYCFYSLILKFVAVIIVPD